MQTQSRVRVVQVSEVKTEKERKDGKPSREYITVQFSTGNPFIPIVTRNFWQSHVLRNGETVAEWRLGATPEEISKMKGQSFEGSIVSERVKPYEIQNGTDKPTVANTFRTVVFAEENVSQIFRQNGRLLYADWVAEEEAKALAAANKESVTEDAGASIEEAAGMTV